LCGFGRAEGPFAFQKYNLTPDFVAMSKGITGGYIPFGALYTSSGVAQFYETNVLSCGLTNYAHPLGLAALSAVLNYFSNSEFCENLMELEKCFANELRILEAD